MMHSLTALSQVCERDAPGVLALWHRLASLETASPKVWMDAYLSAFAITAGLRMISLDQDFRNFVTHGLDLVLICP